MKDQDLKIATQKLIEENLSLVIVKNEKIIFETETRGISGFLQAIEKLNQNLSGASIADKIIGVAAAKLCVYSSVSSVFAITVSEGGIRILQDNNVLFFFEKKVTKILNHGKTDVCPFEKLAMDSRSSEEAYDKLRSFVNQLRNDTNKTEC